MAVVFGTWRQQGESKGDTQRRLYAVFSILPMRSWRGHARQRGTNHVSDGSGLGNCMSVYEYDTAPPTRFYLHRLSTSVTSVILDLFVCFFLPEKSRGVHKRKTKIVKTLLWPRWRCGPPFALEPKRGTAPVLVADCYSALNFRAYSMESHSEQTEAIKRKKKKEIPQFVSADEVCGCCAC